MFKNKLYLKYYTVCLPTQMSKDVYNEQKLLNWKSNFEKIR